MLKAESQYAKLVYDILCSTQHNHASKGSSKFVFGRAIELVPEEVPLLQGRKMYPKGIIGELKAFLNNASSQAEFEKHGCNFWGAWAKEDGSLDVDYARLLFNFNGVNQLEKVAEQLKAGSGSRKKVISLWDPSSKAAQPPCVMYYQWQIVNGTLSMIWNQRSADVMIGLASDMFSAWLFNQVMALHVGLEPGTVIMHLGDAHIYAEHFEAARRYLTQTTEIEALPLPAVHLSLNNLQDWDVEISLYHSQHALNLRLLT